MQHKDPVIIIIIFFLNFIKQLKIQNSQRGYYNNNNNNTDEKSVQYKMQKNITLTLGDSRNQNKIKA